jgi:hypothetical protein
MIYGEGCCDCRYSSGQRDGCDCACHDEGVGCCSRRGGCDNIYHRSSEWPPGTWPCSYNARPDRVSPSSDGCPWFVEVGPRHQGFGTPYRLGPRCEEHNCLSCGQFPCNDMCLGEQLYECARCRHHFLRFQISRVGAAELCRDCARDPMGALRR